MLNETLLDVEKYEEDPRQTPVLVCEKLLSIILPKAKFIELLAIGGEGVLLKALDETEKLIVIKIARSNIQNKYCQTPQHARLINLFKLGDKAKPTNASYERFLEGAVLQRDLFQQLIDDQITYFAVPQVYQISSEPLFYVMPYLENINILRYFKDFKKNLRAILDVYLNLVRAIKYLHSKSIIHRDIKSDNILIHKNLKGVILLDWTLAKVIGDRNLTVAGTIGGTPGLASQKFMDGNFKNANFRDDIYSLGFVLWEFVTGKRIATIYDHRQLKLTKEKQENFKRQIISYIPECLQFIFWKSTEFAEKDRYETTQDLENAIITVIQNFDLRQNTIISDQQEREINKVIHSVIVDTSAEFSLCRTCGDKKECAQYEICNLFKSLLSSTVNYSIGEKNDKK